MTLVKCVSTFSLFTFMMTGCSTDTIVSQVSTNDKTSRIVVPDLFTVVACAKDGYIYEYNYSSDRFEKTQGLATSVASASSYNNDGKCAWHVNSRGLIYRLDKNLGWVNVPGCYGNDIGALSNDFAFATGKDNCLYEYNSSTDRFDKIQGLGVRIDIQGTTWDQITTVWHVNSAGKVYRHDLNSGWVEVPGCVAEDIAAGSYFDTFHSTIVAAVGTDGCIYSYSSSEDRFNKIETGSLPSAKRIAIDFYSEYWIVTTTGSIIRYSNPNDFHTVPGSENLFADIGA